MNEHKDGICPLCGTEIKYEGAYDHDDIGATLGWTCPSCNASGKAGYTFVFDQHYQIKDCNGNEVVVESDGEHTTPLPECAMNIINEENYPFQFWCNASGDLFKPGSKDTIQFTELPFPLMRLYHRYWGENYGALCYMVQKTASEEYGLLLIQEYQDAEEQDTGASLTLYEKIEKKGVELETAFKAAGINPDIYIGYQSGFNGCHELMVFIPSTSDDVIFQKTLYALTRDAISGPPFENATEDDLERFRQFSYIRRKRDTHRQTTYHAFAFAEHDWGEENATICVHAFCEIEDIDETIEQLQSTCDAILAASQHDGESIDPDELVTIACDMILGYGKWQTVPTVGKIHI